MSGPAVGRPAGDLRVCLLEVAQSCDCGSIGAFYIEEHARRAGYPVDRVTRPTRGYDIELASVHHCDDFGRLAALPRMAPIRIVGGHPMANNPRPCLPFADAVCVGEGESWIREALPRLARHRDVAALAELPGTILPGTWEPGAPLPRPNVERPLPDNPAYLNRPGTRSAAWYLEIARGCPYSCHFCELGHSLPYRLYRADHLKALIDAIKPPPKKMNFYAPDEASHPDYLELYEHLKRRGFNAAFSSMRVDSILRKGIPELPQSYLIRIGLDGLTEATRQRVGKHITPEQLERYFGMMLARGHCQFKMFMIVGYPWEELADFDEFEDTMDRVMRLPLIKNVSLRIKWTPLIPQPSTPLAQAEPRYDHAMVDRIRVWHALHARPRREPGWFIENDGNSPMSERSHRRQWEWTVGNEFALLGLPEARPLHPFAGPGGPP